MVKEIWKPGHPSEKIFFQIWWVWDGKSIFLAHWRIELETWELVGESWKDFKPEHVTHYAALEMPHKPQEER